MVKANALAGTFAFLPSHRPTENKQKSQQDNAQGHCKHQATELRPKRSPAGNSTFAIGGVLCSADRLVVAESFVLRINIGGEKPAHRKSAKRWQ